MATIIAEERPRGYTLQKNDLLILAGVEYLIDKVIATSGGMANVYKGIRTSNKISVLIKEVNLDGSDGKTSVMDENNKQALVNEYELVKLFTSNNIPRVFDILRAGGFAYIITDFVLNSESLKQVWDARYGRLKDIMDGLYDDYVKANPKITRLYDADPRYDGMPRNELGIPMVPSKNGKELKPSRSLPEVKKKISDKAKNIAKSQGVFYKEEDLVKHMTKMCTTIGYLHKFSHETDEGILQIPMVYRDFKLSNVLINRSGDTFLIDFGITRTLYSDIEAGIKNKTDVLGTMFYAPPEQMKAGEDLDQRSDIFSMGVTMYSLMTLRRPSELWESYDKNGNSLPLRSKKAVGDRPKRLTYEDIQGNIISSGLAKVIAKCIQPNPNDRYQTVEELQAALLLYKSQSDQALESAKRKIKKYKTVMVTSAVLAALGVGTGGAAYASIQNLYSTTLQSANQVGNIENYSQAVNINPTNTEAYVAMLENQERKGTFTEKEEAQILSVINPNTAKIKDSAEYGKIAYLLGKMYWVYYPDSVQGKMQAASWLRIASDEGYSDNGLTKVLLDTSDFYKTIAYDQKQSNDAGKYVAFLDRLDQNKNTPMPQKVSIEYHKILNNFLASYSYNLRADGVNYDRINGELEYLNNWADTFKGNNIDNDKEVAKLKASLQNTKKSVDSSYGN